MYDAIDVARYIIAYESSRDRFVSNLKLQKLLYFVQAIFVVHSGKPCFSTRIEAWVSGPIVLPVYRAYRIFGCCPIPNAPSTASMNTIKKSDRQLINEMLEACSSLSSVELYRRISFQEPWKNAYNNMITHEITPDAMKEYFNRE